MFIHHSASGQRTRAVTLRAFHGRWRGPLPPSWPLTHLTPAGHHGQGDDGAGAHGRQRPRRADRDCQSKPERRQRGAPPWTARCQGADLGAARPCTVPLPLRPPHTVRHFPVESLSPKALLWRVRERYRSHPSLAVSRPLNVSPALAGRSASSRATMPSTCSCASSGGGCAHRPQRWRSRARQSIGS